MATVQVLRVLRILAVAALILVGVPATADAHGGSYDMKYVDGSNLVLVTFNTHQAVSGLAIMHNIRLYDLVGAPIPFEEAKVEVHTSGDSRGITLRGHTLLEEQTLALSPNNDTSMTYTYPRSGGYRLLVTFWSEGRQISRGDFAVDVGQGSAAGVLAGLRLPQTVAAFGLGLACYHLVARRRVARTVQV